MGVTATSQFMVAQAYFCLLLYPARQIWSPELCIFVLKYVPFRFNVAIFFVPFIRLQRVLVNILRFLLLFWGVEAPCCLLICFQPIAVSIYMCVCGVHTAYSICMHAATQCSLQSVRCAINRDTQILSCVRCHRWCSVVLSWLCAVSCSQISSLLFLSPYRFFSLIFFLLVDWLIALSIH